MRSDSDELTHFIFLSQVGQAVLNTVAVLAVDLADPSTSIYWASRPFEEMFGYEHNELRGQPLTVLMRPESALVHARHFARYRESPNARGMNRGLVVDAVKKDGTIFKIQIGLKTSEVGRKDYAFATATDVTSLCCTPMVR